MDLGKTQEGSITGLKPSLTDINRERPTEWSGRWTGPTLTVYFISYGEDT